MLKHVHHVHYIVKNRDEMIEYLERNFGMKPSHVVDLKGGKQKDAVYAVGQTRIQITEPHDPTSRPGKFLAEHGPGLLHVAWAVDDMDKLVQHLIANGNKVNGSGTKQGLSPRGYKVVNIDESSAHGLWFQLAEGEHRIED